MSQSSGIVADDRVNCDSAKELTENAIKGIVVKRFAEVTLKRKVQVFAMAAMGNTIIIDKDPVVVNRNQLFHRIACVSLFNNVGLRAGKKSEIVKVIDNISNKLPENPSYVLDGGDLLPRVQLPSLATYGDVCNAYLDYVNRNYGTKIIVVLEGYEPSTKDAVHMRRAVGKSAGRVDVAPSNAVTTAKEQFLSNVENRKN
ncbi:hypothetical protein AVEN_196143-1 [Araneus ventricosus]|uniref:Uncharacterized protein n=1 Tax=Araneus ventricosus TaxID=182803 RepID=A0A4Y2E3B4_ARAVE|nr:hypothetical protein AVEN_196143-1 [Araneus ventricosus]